jgi:hypothetical protein
LIFEGALVHQLLVTTFPEALEGNHQISLG